MHSVYIHRRIDNNQVMYVGCGINDRPFITTSRSKAWNNVANTFGYSIDVVKSGMDEYHALMLEAMLIHRYKTNGYLVNRSPGHVNKLLTYGVGITNHVVAMYGYDIKSRGYTPDQVSLSIKSNYNQYNQYMLIKWGRCIDTASYNQLKALYLECIENTGFHGCDIWKHYFNDGIDRRVLTDYFNNEYYDYMFNTLLPSIPH